LYQVTEICLKDNNKEGVQKLLIQLNVIFNIIFAPKSLFGKYRIPLLFKEGCPPIRRAGWLIITTSPGTVRYLVLLLPKEETFQTGSKIENFLITYKFN